jgi:hypothetical protein
MEPPYDCSMVAATLSDAGLLMLLDLQVHRLAQPATLAQYSSQQPATRPTAAPQSSHV